MSTAFDNIRNVIDENIRHINLNEQKDLSELLLGHAQDLVGYDRARLWLEDNAVQWPKH